MSLFEHITAHTHAPILRSGPARSLTRSPSLASYQLILTSTESDIFPAIGRVKPRTDPYLLALPNLLSSR